MSERTYYDGKYTVRARPDGGLEFLRYGEAWPAADDLRFSNLVGAMFREQLDADAEIAALKQRVAELERERDAALKVCEAAGVVIDDTRNASYADCCVNKGKVCDLFAALAAYRATKGKTNG